MVCRRTLADAVVEMVSQNCLGEKKTGCGAKISRQGCGSKVIPHQPPPSSTFPFNDTMRDGTNQSPSTRLQ